MSFLQSCFKFHHSTKSKLFNAVLCTCVLADSGCACITLQLSDVADHARNTDFHQSCGGYFKAFCLECTPVCTQGCLLGECLNHWYADDA